MGLEIVFLYVGLAIAGAFGVNKAVEVYKHSMTIEADKFNSCLTATKDARQCRNLE
jgi:hypothetical protein